MWVLPGRPPEGPGRRGAACEARVLGAAAGLDAVRTEMKARAAVLTFAKAAANDRIANGSARRLSAVINPKNDSAMLLRPTVLAKQVPNTVGEVGSATRKMALRALIRVG